MKPERPKRPADYRELLRTGRWFRGASPALQSELLAAAHLRRLAPEEHLFSRGDPPSGLFAALEGAVRVSALLDGGKEALLTLVVPPAWFGEIAVFDALERTHDAIADGEALVLHVPQAALDAILAREPSYWRELALLLTHKLRLMFVVFEEASALPVAVRLARRILTMAEGYGEWHDRKRRVVSVKQEQLAAMLAISRQTANQALRRLEAQGVVRLTYGEIEIVDHAALRAAAGVAVTPA
jgi:CRP-like cAMP-binding protein